MCPWSWRKAATTRWRPARQRSGMPAALQAPSKRLVWFENSAHTPHLEEPGKFRDLLLEVRDSGAAKSLTMRSQP